MGSSGHIDPKNVPLPWWPNMLDLLIKNGLIFDGLGPAPFQGDVGIKNGKIASIAVETSASAKKVVDAKGLWVTPGFIDIHTHYDLEVEIAPALLESVRHGVTSVVMGNCSLSLTIGKPATLGDIFLRVENIPRVLVRKWLDQAVSWDSMEKYFTHLNEIKLGPNIAPMLGHSALRAEVMGLERSLKEHATQEELKRMRDLARKALDVGCIGISIDMVPWHMMSGPYKGRPIPSHHANFKEIRMLADVCREKDAVFQVTPNPQNALTFLQLMWLSVGFFKRPLRITILAALDTTVNRNLWHLFSPLLFLFNKILRCNVRFQTLTEPFTVYSDGPLTPLFEEFSTGVQLNDLDSRGERTALWKTPGFKEKFKEQWCGGKRRTFHRNLASMKVVRCPEHSLENKTFAEIAQNRDAIDLFMDLLEKYDTDLRWVSTGANDRLLPRLALMSHEHILPGFTDAGAHARNLGYYDGAISLLRQAVTTGFLSPEAAICRVTGEPARWFRLDTGILKEGTKADFLLIDPIHLKNPISEQVEIDDPILDGAMRMVKRGSEKIVKVVCICGEIVYKEGNATEVLGHSKLGNVLKQIDSTQEVKIANHLLKGSLRNRINDQILAHPFNDYWEIFVFKHQNPWNIALHAAGVAYIYFFLGFALITKNFWLLLFLPISQLIGLVGHYFFERNHIDLQDAVFSLRASKCLNRMFYRILTGKYFDDIRTVRARLKKFQDQANQGNIPMEASS
jgi:N-acyl-D-aspartate/D-glutamate deacylase